MTGGSGKRTNTVSWVGSGELLKTPVHKKLRETEVNSDTGAEEPVYIEVDLHHVDDEDDTPLKLEISCPVCMGILEHPCVIKACLHRFCKECFEKVVANYKMCPSCRNQVGNRREGTEDARYSSLVNVLSENNHDYIDKSVLKQGSVRHLERTNILRKMANRKRQTSSLDNKDKNVYFRLVAMKRAQDGTYEIKNDGKSEIIDKVYDENGNAWTYGMNNNSFDNHLIQRDPAVVSRDNLCEKIASRELRKSYLSSPMKASIEDIKRFLKVKKEQEELAEASLTLFEYENEKSCAGGETQNKGRLILDSVSPTFVFNYELFILYNGQMRHLSDDITLKTICQHWWEYNSPLNLFFSSSQA